MITRAQICAAAHAALRASRAEQGVEIVGWMQLDRARVCELRDAVHVIVQTPGITAAELLDTGWRFFGAAAPEDAQLLIATVRALTS